MKPLNKLNTGQKAFIVDMRNAELCERLFELGVFPGDMIEVKRNSETDSSMIFKVNNQSFNIHKNIAETIITNVVSFEIHLN